MDKILDLGTKAVDTYCYTSFPYEVMIFPFVIGVICSGLGIVYILNKKS